jgi:hypothetical protein
MLRSPQSLASLMGPLLPTSWEIVARCSVSRVSSQRDSPHCSCAAPSQTLHNTRGHAPRTGRGANSGGAPWQSRVQPSCATIWQTMIARPVAEPSRTRTIPTARPKGRGSPSYQQSRRRASEHKHPLPAFLHRPRWRTAVASAAHPSRAEMARRQPANQLCPEYFVTDMR